MPTFKPFPGRGDVPRPTRPSGGWDVPAGAVPQFPASAPINLPMIQRRSAADQMAGLLAVWEGLAPGPDGVYEPIQFRNVWNRETQQAEAVPVPTEWTRVAAWYTGTVEHITVLEDGSLSRSFSPDEIPFDVAALRARWEQYTQVLFPDYWQSISAPGAESGSRSNFWIGR